MLRIFLGSHLKVALKVELWFFNELGHRFVTLNWRSGLLGRRETWTWLLMVCREEQNVRLHRFII